MSADPFVHGPSALGKCLLRVWRCRGRLFFVALSVSLASGSLRAAGQGLNLGGASQDRPIDISADAGIEWQQEAQVYIAHGNAVAKRGTTEVHADTLTAHYRPSKTKGGGDNEIYRLDADGHVTIKGETQTVVGDQAVWDVDQQVGIVTGKALKLTTATDVVTARDSFEWYDGQQIAVARGDAVAVRLDAKRIRADVLTAHMTKDTAKSGDASPQRKPAQAGANAENSRIRRVDAQGNVLVSTPTEIGRGDYGVYNADTGIATLLDNVTITRGPNAIRGQYAVMDLNNNVSRMMAAGPGAGAPAGRVEGLFIRQDQTGTPAGGRPNASVLPTAGSAQRP
jgi:lipopolysaccharide export system protein LptA